MPVKKIAIHPELARTVLDDLPAGLALIDQYDSIAWVNDALAKMLHVEADELIGRAACSLPLPRPTGRPQGLASMEPEVRTRGSLVGLARPYRTGDFEGQALLVFDRGHSLVWAINALASGSLEGLMVSGALSQEATCNRLELEISRSRRYANPLSCLMARVHTTNDSDAGVSSPARMAEVVRILKEHLRWVDVLGQLDDETVVVVLPETDAQAAHRLQEKLAVAVDLYRSDALAATRIVWGNSSWRKGDDVSRMLRRAGTMASQSAGG
jgi:hypothetical protein